MQPGAGGTWGGRVLSLAARREEETAGVDSDALPCKGVFEGAQDLGPECNSRTGKEESIC